MSYNSFKAHKRVAWVKDRSRGEEHDLPHRFAFEVRPEFADRDGRTLWSFPTIRECEDLVIRGKKPSPAPSPQPEARVAPPAPSPATKRTGTSSCKWCASLGYDRCLITGRKS